ncbi:hypothetical protein GEMRC1_010626 [Eukaryota sp. GEM-RC1]
MSHVGLLILLSLYFSIGCCHVYSFGLNRNGAVAVDTDVIVVSNPLLIPNLSALPIHSLSTGISTSHVTISNSSVFGFGNDRNCAVGICRRSDVILPTLLPIHPFVLQSTSSSDHLTYFLLSNHTLLYSGRKTSGKYFPSYDGSFVTSPLPIDSLPPVKQISGHAYHALCLTIDGQLYGIGSNLYYVLGFSNFVGELDTLYVFP